jgi:hypothetical protein
MYVLTVKINYREKYNKMKKRRRNFHDVLLQGVLSYKEGVPNKEEE